MNMKKSEYICYGIGIIPEAMISTVVSLYLLFFSTEILGLKSSAVGLILLLANILDIVTDIIIMNFVDKKKTRFGIYRPWLISAIPMAICMMLIFLFPDFLENSTQKLLWIGALYFLMIPLFETAYLDPYYSLRIRISSDKNDQVRLSSANTVFENLGQLLAVLLAAILISGKTAELSDWRACTLCIVGISVLCTAVCFFGTKERAEQEEKPIRFLPAIRILLREAPFFRVISSLIILYIPWAMYSSILAYFCTYNLGHEEWMNPIALASLAFSVVVGLAASPVVRRIGKKKMIGVCTVILAISAVMFAFVKDLPTLLLFCIIKDIGQTGAYICIHAYVPEVNTKVMTENKIAVTGLIIGIISAFGKIGLALGNYFSSAVLTVGGYDAALSVQSAATLDWIRFSVCALYLFAAVFVFLINRKGIMR